MITHIPPALEPPDDAFEMDPLCVKKNLKVHNLPHLLETTTMDDGPPYVQPPNSSGPISLNKRFIPDGNPQHLLSLN